MGNTSFDAFVRTATGHAPYQYQCRLACGPQADPRTPNTLRVGAVCQSQLINIPTGLGKTAAVVLAWLWNRVHLNDSKWPRRLVYCLPMRTLVEQTEREAAHWLTNLLGKADALNLGADAMGHLEWLVEHSPVILMGGEEADRKWDIWPEKPAILIGTQDMLLSRALNRGYGMSRYRWPMHFGLMNNDCLWVMDETQLMGVGVETSAQLDGFRNDGKMPTAGACPTWWMSATLDELRLATVDHPRPAAGWPMEKLSDAEHSSGRPHELITAKKSLLGAPLALTPATRVDYGKRLAELIVERHRHGTLSLVVVNRVERARAVFEALITGEKKGKQTLPPLYASENVALIHSRFRPVDRDRHTNLLFGEGDRIVIATQAVEAGVDVSADLLITELAPWSSLVQRIGRCNRRAEATEAHVMWVDIAPDPKGELLLPYTKGELDKAREALSQPTPLADASPKSLTKRGQLIIEEAVIRPVIRRRDLVDLFDTTPDLCGQDLDVSRYIRDGEDSDVQFYWRDVRAEMPREEEPVPLRRELCRVSIGDAREFLKKARAWRWNPLEENWEPAKARPGAVCLVAADSGGYDNNKGWTKNPKDKPTPCPPDDADEKESYGNDPDAFPNYWQELDKHTQVVVAATEMLTAQLPVENPLHAALRTAARWHDVGKAHKEFQAMLRDGDASREGKLWAKSAQRNSKCKRRGFRHELASALAWLLAGPAEAPERDLIAYLIAAHHGKVRLSIRSLPNEPAPPGDDRLFARGIWQGDELPSIPLGDITTPAVKLDLSSMRMGEGPCGPSWLARTVALRDRLGPFRLAYLEMLLRGADARASSEEDPN